MSLRYPYAQLLPDWTTQNSSMKQLGALELERVSRAHQNVPAFVERDFDFVSEGLNFSPGRTAY